MYHIETYQPGSKVKKNRLNHEINITPLMDIVLVLLIIFMLFAMNVISNLQVNLPSAKSNNAKTTEETISISVTNTGSILYDNKTVSISELSSLLSKANKKLSISIYADKKIEYGIIAKVLGVVQSANFSKVNLMVSKG